VQDCERLLAKENEPIESNDERDKKLTTLLSVGSEFTKHFRFSFDPRLFIEPVGAAMPHAQPGLLSMFGLHVSFLVLTENSLC
jgi:hypothetical protein